MTVSCSIRFFGLILITCLGAAACGSKTGTNPVGPTPPAPAGNLTVDVAEINGPYSFYPSPVSVESGRSIVWHNTDTVAHRVVFDELAIDTGTLAPGTLSQPMGIGSGTWSYHCAIHPSMVGAVTVAAPR